MPQPSYEYALGRISALATQGLTEAKLREIIWEITPDGELTEPFLLDYDTHNLKVLLKARLLKQEVPPILLAGGRWEAKQLAEMVAQKSYATLAPAYSAALSEIEQALEREIDPFSFSARLDRAMFEHIDSTLKRRKEKSFIHKYFTVLVDFQNTSFLLRARRLELTEIKLKELLLPGGSIPKRSYLAAFNLPESELKVALAQGSSGKLISKVLEELETGAAATALTEQRDKALENIMEGVKWESSSLGPLIYCLYHYQKESKKQRLAPSKKEVPYAR